MTQSYTTPTFLTRAVGYLFALNVGKNSAAGAHLENTGGLCGTSIRQTVSSSNRAGVGYFSRMYLHRFALPFSTTSSKKLF